MIRDTGKHTFEASASERQQEWVSRALVQYCRRVRQGAWVPEAELVDVAQAQVDESFDQPAVLSILRSEEHNYDDRLRFEEWTAAPRGGSERHRPPNMHVSRRTSCDGSLQQQCQSAS